MVHDMLLKIIMNFVRTEKSEKEDQNYFGMKEQSQLLQVRQRTKRNKSRLALEDGLNRCGPIYIHI
jgi:hypothetical protein